MHKFTQTTQKNTDDSKEIARKKNYTIKPQINPENINLFAPTSKFPCQKHHKVPILKQPRMKNVNLVNIIIDFIQLQAANKSSSTKLKSDIF